MKLVEQRRSKPLAPVLHSIADSCQMVTADYTVPISRASHVTWKTREISDQVSSHGKWEKKVKKMSCKVIPENIVS